MTPTQLGIAHGMMLVREACRFGFRWPPRDALVPRCCGYQRATSRLGAGPTKALSMPQVRRALAEGREVRRELEARVAELRAGPRRKR